MAHDIGKRGTATIIAALQYFLKHADPAARNVLFKKAVEDMTGPGSPLIPEPMSNDNIRFLCEQLLREYCRVGYIDEKKELSNT